MDTPLFKDRVDAATKLTAHLERFREEDCVVFGLPRGGAVTASIVAKELGKPLGLLIVRKLSHPQQQEYAIGAITDEGEVIVNESAVREASETYVEAEKQRRLNEARSRRQMYLGDAPPPDVKGKTAIIVDDGIATGYTIRAAAIALKKKHPAKVVIAAPVGPSDVNRKLEGVADEVVVPWKPHDFYAIGAYYIDFDPVSNDVVSSIMKEHRRGACSTRR